jgi:hypothetical protein
MHKKIRCLQVEFSEEIAPYEIPAFRGAIINKVGDSYTLFHNHQAGGKFRYQYPLIQYKALFNRPMIVCVDEGVDEIHRFFQQPNWRLSISGRDLDIKIERLEMKQYTMQVWEKSFSYHIRNWVALSQESYKRYLSLAGLVEQVQFLETILIGNILSFAKGIGWHIEKPVEAKINNIQRTGLVTVKGVRVMAFSLDFKSNIFLPNYIGLGRNVSIGYGTVKQLKKH